MGTICIGNINPYPAKLIYLNFHPLVVATHNFKVGGELLIFVLFDTKHFQILGVWTYISFPIT